MRYRQVRTGLPRQYYNRYANHEQSAKLEKELYVKIEKKMEEMQNSSQLSWIEVRDRSNMTSLTPAQVQFLKKAVETLSACRATLRWSYAHAFYLVKVRKEQLESG